MSLAVLLLIENVSAAEVHRHHRHHGHGRPTNSLVQKKRTIEGPFYKATKAGANWFDLDDPSERLHGTEDQDFKTAYDPDVVDAPEDLPRVGNDHQELSNAKLSPDGYYNGFFHKDYQGNYAQQSRKALKARKHHHHHPHRQYVQFDHDNDEEDYLYDNELRAVERMENGEEDDETNVQFNHELDTEDIDLNMPAPKMRGGARQRMAEDAEWEAFFQKGAAKMSQEESEWDKTNVQLADSMDLIKHNKGEPFLYEGELVQQNTEDKSQQLTDEVQGIMEQQAKEDAMNVQLGYMHIPHAEDTEDIVDDEEKAYDHHHSKEWNALVDRRAEELDNEMKSEEAAKVAAKQAAAEAERKAIEDRAKAEAEKRKQAQQLAQQKTTKMKVQTVDFNDIYTGITPDEITLQTGSTVDYEHHSRFWNEEVDKQTSELEKTISKEEEAENKVSQVYGTTDGLTEEKFQSAEQREAAEQKTHHKTIDMEELYDGMAVQTEDHSLYWENRVSAAQNQLEELMRQQDAPKFDQENTSNDLNELYNGMAVQTVNTDHSQYWENRVSSAQMQLEEMMRKSEEPKFNQENTSNDLNELYNGMALQTKYENLHSQNWYNQQAQLDQAYARQAKMDEINGVDPMADEAPAVHHDTINQAELYNQIALQTGYENIHSQFWYDNEAAEEKEFENQEKREMIAQMEGIDTQAEEVPEEHHRTIDMGELYDGLAVQTGYENLHSQYWYDQQAQVEKSFA